MMKITGLACGFVLATCCVVQAQVTTTTTTTTTPPGNQIRKVSQLIGSSVRLQGSNDFGKVQDVVLNENGAPAYMVVSHGGKYAMFPWQAADINYGQRVVNYSVAPDAVQPLFFAPNAWPNISDQQFTTRLNKVFPNAGTVRRETLRPVGPGGPVIQDKEKIKERPNGSVKVKEKERVK